MIKRAKRALPGMVMSLLISAPALAAPAHGDKATTTHRTTAAKTDHRSVSPGHAPAAIARAAKAPPRMAVNRAHGPIRPKVREVSPTLSQGSYGRLIRRASLRVGEHADAGGPLIDDGTLWREQGNLATWQQTGVASWYGGSRWQGHQMSSGARYDEHALTAAHATLPLGTKVRVSRNDGQRSVIVTITDRPGTRTRIIDLSRAAAKELGILDSGVAMVTLQPM